MQSRCCNSFAVVLFIREKLLQDNEILDWINPKRAYPAYPCCILSAFAHLTYHLTDGLEFGVIKICLQVARLKNEDEVEE